MIALVWFGIVLSIASMALSVKAILEVRERERHRRRLEQNRREFLFEWGSYIYGKTGREAPPVYEETP